MNKFLLPLLLSAVIFNCNTAIASQNNIKIENYDTQSVEIFENVLNMQGYKNLSNSDKETLKRIKSKF